MMETMVSSDPSKGTIYDPVRKRWVACSPEERVRQSLLIHMLNSLSYPKELLSIEKALHEMPHLSTVSSLPERRVDILCYGKGIHPEHQLYPLLMIECKECSTMQEQAKEQVIGYNHFVKAYFLAIAYPGKVECGYFDVKKNVYTFFDHLPPFPKLISALHHAKNH